MFGFVLEIWAGGLLKKLLIYLVVLFNVYFTWQCSVFSHLLSHIILHPKPSISHQCTVLMNQPMWVWHVSFLHCITWIMTFTCSLSLSLQWTLKWTRQIQMTSVRIHISICPCLSINKIDITVFNISLQFSLVVYTVGNHFNTLISQSPILFWKNNANICL